MPRRCGYVVPMMLLALAACDVTGAADRHAVAVAAEKFVGHESGAALRVLGVSETPKVDDKCTISPNTTEAMFQPKEQWACKATVVAVHPGTEVEASDMCQVLVDRGWTESSADITCRDCGIVRQNQDHGLQYDAKLPDGRSETALIDINTDVQTPPDACEPRSSVGPDMTQTTSVTVRMQLEYVGGTCDECASDGQYKAWSSA